MENLLFIYQILFDLLLRAQGDNVNGTVKSLGLMGLTSWWARQEQTHR